MTHCGINWWNNSVEIRGVVDYRYLAITTSPIISIASTYIVFVTKMQKRQTLEKGSALFKNDITGSEPTFKTWNI